MSKSEMQVQNDRLTAFNVIATELTLLSDKRLSELLANATPLHTTIGGTSMLLLVGDRKVFVKKIRLTDIERRPENIMSTANVFNLPTYFQYGVGSPGFGVWRDLAAHIMCTNWVLSGECINFPLLYHWRMLPNPEMVDSTAEQLKEVEDRVKFWEGSPAARARLEANLSASAEIILFLENIPENLHVWLGKQMAIGGDVADSACAMVEANLNAITSFINKNGLLHFDAHFWNILTDGHRLYLTDFGLAISDRFELSESDVVFFKAHHNYDRCYTRWFIVEWILTELFGKKVEFKEHYNALLHDYSIGKGRTISPVIDKILANYAPVAVVMNEFFIKLKESKKTPYPTSELDRIFKGS